MIHRKVAVLSVTHAQAQLKLGCGFVDWTAIFDLAKADVGSEKWPPGFARWLEAELPGVMGSVISKL